MRQDRRNLGVGLALADLDVGPLVSRAQKSVVERPLTRTRQSGPRVVAQGWTHDGGVESLFGGFRHSGHGCEKCFDALCVFSVLKTVAILHGA